MKKGGLYVVGTVLEGDFEHFADSTLELRRAWLEFIDKHNIKAFPQVLFLFLLPPPPFPARPKSMRIFQQVSVAPNARVGYENLLLLCGLGAMQPNTVVLPLLRQKRKRKAPTSLLSSPKPESSEKPKEAKPVESTVSPEKEEEKEEKEKPLSPAHVEIPISSPPSYSRSESTGSAFGDRKLSIFDRLPADLRHLVVDSPATMDPVEYLMLLRNIMRVEKNIVITENFHNMDSNLVVSTQIADKMRSSSKRKKEKTEQGIPWTSDILFVRKASQDTADTGLPL